MTDKELLELINGPSFKPSTALDEYIRKYGPEGRRMYEEDCRIEEGRLKR